MVEFRHCSTLFMAGREASRLETFQVISYQVAAVSLLISSLPVLG